MIISGLVAILYYTNYIHRRMFHDWEKNKEFRDWSQFERGAKF